MDGLEGFESGAERLIRLTHVKKVYQTSAGPVEALTDLNLEINQGEIFGVIGYSGAGKSTLIRLINLLEQPTDGRVEVAGHVLSALSEKELGRQRKQIGMIFQHFNLLWSRTVAENIAFPLELSKLSRDERRKRVEELVRLVGLKGRESSYPSQLSGGQKQRVGIARALANNPKVLLCDEATSALDPKTTDSILQLLSDINRSLGLTIVLITHEMHVITQICHHVAVLDKGSIVEEGAVSNIFLNPRQAITREFVKQVAGPLNEHDRIEKFRAANPGSKIVKLIFDGKNDQQPAVDLLFRDQTLHVKIIVSELSPTKNGVFGTLVLLMGGHPQSVQSAIDAVRSESVTVEVLYS